METNPCNNPINIGFSVPSKVRRRTRSENTIINVNGVKVGGAGIVVIAGPCG
jgi:hypothetical protein